jgi:iron complex outermembrane receptor protein
VQRACTNGDGATVTTASIAWQFRPDMRLLLRRDEVLRYASVDENGFTLPGVSVPCEPQTGASWEGGLEWFDRALQRPRDAVRPGTRRRDCSTTPAALGPGAMWGMLGANINLDSSRRRGVLLEWRWQPLERLSLGGSYTWTDAELTAGHADGKDVPYVAKHAGALNANWDFGYGFSLFAEYAYTGSRYALGDDLNAFNRVDAEGLLNAALRWTSGPWNATLRGNNLGNRKYDTLTSEWYDAALATAVHARSVYPAARRTVYLTVGYRF